MAQVKLFQVTADVGVKVGVEVPLQEPVGSLFYHVNLKSRATGGMAL